MFQTNFGVRKRATILNGATNSDTIDWRHYSFGTVKWPAAFTGATVSFVVCDTSTGTFVPLTDDVGTLITLTVSVSKTTPLPVELAGAAYFQFVSASAEGADRSLVMTCKP